MITPNPVNRLLAASRDEDVQRQIPPSVPRLRDRGLAPVASLLAGVLGLLAIAARSL